MAKQKKRIEVSLLQEMTLQNERLRQVTEQWGSAAYYDRVLKRRAEGKVTWNWGAFFFGAFWLTMHKMYTRAIFRLVLDFGSGLLCSGAYLGALYGFGQKGFINFTVLRLFLALPLVYTLVQNLIFGLYGNRWLFNDLLSKLDQGANPRERPLVHHVFPIILIAVCQVAGLCFPWGKFAETTGSWAVLIFSCLGLCLVVYLWPLVIL